MSTKGFQTLLNRLFIVLILGALVSCGKSRKTYAGFWFPSDTDKAMDELIDKNILDTSALAKEIEYHYGRYDAKKEKMDDYPYIIKLMKLSDDVPPGVITAFLEAEASATAADQDDGVKPLEYACKQGNAAWVKALMDAMTRYADLWR